MVIGFSWGGWMTGSTANRLAAERADTAVVAALTPVCVEKFLQNSDAQANLAVITKIPSILGYAFARRKSEQNSSLQLLQGAAGSIARHCSRQAVEIDSRVLLRPGPGIGPLIRTRSSLPSR